MLVSPGSMRNGRNTSGGWTRATLALLAVFAPTLVAAQPVGDPHARDKARAKLTEGAWLFQAGDYVTALTSFEQAHAMFPSPKIFYNIGLANEKLGRWGAAFMAFERFLRHSTESPREHVVHSREQLERLSPKVAFVAVSCDVSDAEVRLDGDWIGRTPLPNRTRSTLARTKSRFGAWTWGAAASDSPPWRGKR